MRRIALAAVNARYAHTNPALLYLERALKSAECAESPQVDLIEWHISQPRRGLLERLAAGYDLVAFSVYIWNAPFLKAFLPDLRRAIPGVVTVLGGPEAVLSADEWLALEGVDYIVDGEAGEAAPLLLSLEASSIPRLLSLPRSEGSLPPSPYTPELLRRLEGRAIYYEAGRGCPFRCAYCLSSRGGGMLRQRGREELERDTALLSGFRGSVRFVDRSFNALPDVSRTVWRLLAETPPAGRFHFELHPLLLEEEDFRLLESLPPGRVRFEIGIQSTDSRVLEAAGRKGDWKREAAAVERLRRMGRFELHLDQIVGLPEDTPRSAERTLDDILSLEPDIFQLGFLKLLPGTELWTRREELGLISSATPPYELLRSPGFSFAELARFHRLADLIEVLVNRGEFRRSLAAAAVLAGGHAALLACLLAEDGVDTRCRRWEYWAAALLRWAGERYPDEGPVLLDLLRFDWASRAEAPRYPESVSDGGEGALRELRRHALPRLRERYPYASAAELNRAVLYLPATEAGRRACGAGACFFLTVDGERVSEPVPDHRGGIPPSGVPLRHSLLKGTTSSSSSCSNFRGS